MPGDSPWQSVEGLISPLGIFSVDITHPLSGQMDYYLDVEFTQQDNTVTAIDVASALFSSTATHKFAADWDRYSWSQIMARHGEPSQVRFEFRPPVEPNAPVYYQLWLVYDERGIIAYYEGPAEGVDEREMRTCLRFQDVSYIRLHLEAPQESNVLMRGVYPLSMQASTGVDKSSFYAATVASGQEVCVQAATP